MGERYIVKAHLPRGAVDATYHIVDAYTDNHDVVAIVDPHMIYAGPCEVAEEIAKAMNTMKVMD